MDRSRRTVLGALAAAGSTAGCLGSVGGSGAEAETIATLGTIRSEFTDRHMLSVSWESDTDAVRTFWREYDGTWPVASDPEAETAERVGVEGLPTLVLFDRSGQERWRHVGLAGTDSLRSEVRGASKG